MVIHVVYSSEYMEHISTYLQPSLVTPSQLATLSILSAVARLLVKEHNPIPPFIMCMCSLCTDMMTVLCTTISELTIIIHNGNCVGTEEIPFYWIFTIITLKVPMYTINT